MRKQTKLMAVLSVAAMITIGMSMTSFGAGSWEQYGDLRKWKDENGETAYSTLIEENGDYYYVDMSGYMITNEWVVVDNENAGQEGEPPYYCYYFQADGKAIKGPGSGKVSLKTINGDKYSFHEDGRMMYGWVDAETGEQLDDSDGDAFKEGDYYFGEYSDGAMKVGWMKFNIEYSEATDDDYQYTAPVFTDSADQERWFYFQSNGKKLYAGSEDRTRDRTINGRKYAFDQYGAMVAEWSLDEDTLGTTVTSYSTAAPKLDENGFPRPATSSEVITGQAADAKYSHAWRYFSDVDDGARISKGWFKVVPAEYLSDSKYEDGEPYWYYADGKGNIYAGEFKTIKNKRYAFADDGHMIDGLHFIGPARGFGATDGVLSPGVAPYEGLDVRDMDDSGLPFDNEESFLESAAWYEKLGYKSYYFGENNDGSMRTGKADVPFDGETCKFFFEKSGGHKGAGVTGEKDDRLYMSGMLLKASKDNKYQIIKEVTEYTNDGTDHTVYSKMETADFASTVLQSRDIEDETKKTSFGTVADKANKDLDEAYNLPDGLDTINNDSRVDGVGTVTKYYLVDTSGKIVDRDGKKTDGDGFCIVVSKSKGIVGIYVED